MEKRITLYATIKQICIILDALEHEIQDEGIRELITGLSLTLPVEFLYPPKDRERINTEHSTAAAGKRWIGKFNATYGARAASGSAVLSPTGCRCQNRQRRAVSNERMANR